MENEKVTVNDVLEALAIRTNDVLRPDKKSPNKKNNAYYWAFKAMYLIVLLIIINIVFNSLEETGVSLIYAVAKSLRSILSFFWTLSLAYIKNLMILYLLYDNYKIFVESKYYDNLYEDNRKMKQRKITIFSIVELCLKVFAVFSMISIASLGAISVYAFFTIIFMQLKGVYIISPLIITVSTFLISFFTFMHIKNRFFFNKQTIVKNHFIFAFVLLVIGVVFFGYEISSYEYMNKLPDELPMVSKEQKFTITEGQKIKIKNDSKLNNLQIIYDDTLENVMVVQFDYFETAKVKYTYTLNEYDDLDLEFSSSLDFHPENINDVFDLVHSTFNRKIIYNYNLFKYPNIYVYINSKYEKNITVK